MKAKKTKKELILKTIHKHLFSGFDGRYYAKNTIIIDDSPVKHILNRCENVILPESWTFASVGQSDTYLMDKLLPWVLQLHMNREQDIETFRNLNKIGRPVMCEDPFDLDFSEISKIVDNNYKISAPFVKE